MQNTPDSPATQDNDYCDADSFEFEACGHSFTFYPNGADRLDALVKHIEGAERTLDTFYYMFQEDSAGERVRDALVAAAKRGVEVHLIIDDFGSDAPEEFFDPIVDAGGTFGVFSANWNVRYLIRNHQKFVIADNERVMTGGSNVADQYYDPPEKNGWCDLGVLIEGEVAKQFTDWFKLVREWSEGDGSQFRRIRQMVRNWDPGDAKVRLLVGGPLVRKAHWSFRFKRDLAKAKRLDMVSAYFGPTRSIRKLMAKIARRGDMRLISAGKSDIASTIELARLYYRRLLKAGAKIYEFQPCKLHMKLLVVDNKSYMGSANLDRRSIRINVELMVRVEDEALADRLREFMSHLQEASEPVDQEWFKKHDGYFMQLRQRVLHVLSLADYRMVNAVVE